ncbi:hypothetical protein BJ878DRAFT_309743 [Calycina marina]|uniref:Uncharacterized protein n=1 Tax=Calycina marina TaxID=1763456 RepID=A0A9P7ZBI1_9HELO|nr:hypothetical protein BJ878DRAFT_309743 [Calycina marina]
MAWFSLLPESIRHIEVWIIKFFLFLAALAIGPWLLLILYDILLFIFRVATYHIPYIGGRARNRPRPRAPSLSEKSSGRARTLSLPISATRSTFAHAEEVTVESLRKRLSPTDDDDVAVESG